MMRRSLLFSMLPVAVLASAILYLDPIAAKAEPQDFERFTLDVAVLHPTFAIVPGAIFGETGASTQRGTPFIVDGKIFPGGTLHKGAGTGDPDMPGSVGSWICKGIFTSDLGSEDIGFDTTQMFLFNGDHEAIWTEGLEAGLGKIGVITHRTILGGTGRFRGAQGEVVQESLRTNVGGTPNIRVTFKIERGR